MSKSYELSKFGQIVTVNSSSNSISLSNSSLYTQTMTNRSIDVTISVSNELVLDLRASNFFNVTLDKNISTVTINNVPSGAVVFYSICFNIQGNYSISWPASFKWKNGIPPVISSTVNDKQTLVFYTVDGGTVTQGFDAGYNR